MKCKEAARDSSRRDILGVQEGKRGRGSRRQKVLPVLGNHMQISKE